MQRRVDTILIAAFVAILWLPALATLARTGGCAAVARAAAAPDFDGWWSQNFGLRAPLVRAHARFDYRVFGRSSNPNVLVGKQGWLFYGAPEVVADWQGTEPLRLPDLVAWRRALEERRDWLAERGAAYTFVIAPDKHTIYGHHLPPSLRRVGATSCYDQLVTYLRAHSDVDVVDLRAPLRVAARTERVYYQTDSHWNGRGACVAVGAILEHVARGVPAVGALVRCARTVVRQPGGDLARMMALQDDLVEEAWEATACDPRAYAIEGSLWDWERVYVLTQDAPSLPRAVVLADSFGPRMAPLLAESFQRTAFLHNKAFATALIEREAPQVVIEELVERNLGRVPQNPPEVRAAYLRRLWSEGVDGWPKREPLAATELPGRDARLPLAPLAVGGDTAVLRVDVTSPAAVWLSVHYQIDGARQEVRVRLRAGREVVLIELPGLAVGTRAELELDAIPKPYCVHRVELRIVSDRPAARPAGG